MIVESVNHISSTKSIDPIPERISAVLELFEGPLAEIKFPDINSESLAECAEFARMIKNDINRIEIELSQKRDELRQALDELGNKAARALAYAKIYASGDEELEELVAPLNVAKPRVERPKRGRRKKEKSNSESRSQHLLLVESGEEEKTALND